MTDINKKDTNMNKTDETRAKRRSLLKAGAVIAPLAITLHGGNAMATVISAGRCAENIKQDLSDRNYTIPHYNDNGDVDGQQSFDPDQGFTGRILDSGEPETHWDYLRTNEGIDPNQSCMMSFAGIGNFQQP